MSSKKEKFYEKLIEQKEKLFPSFFLKMNMIEKNELLDAHFIITNECFGFNDYYIYQALLYKLNYFRKEKYILYTDQIQVIQRNISPYESILQTELLRLFEPEKMFIEQCKIIKEKRETFFDRRKSLYDFPKKIKQEGKELFKTDVF